MYEFSHEKLHVYQDGLRFVGYASRAVVGWDTKHAIRDHLPRAAESTVEGIAHACAAVTLPLKQSSSDVSMGSTLECGACLDSAAVKRLIEPDVAMAQKSRLVGIASMLVGLRRSWEARMVRESTVEYGAAHHDKATTFHHEKLDVYQLALKTMEWLVAADSSLNLPVHVYRKLDSGITSIILNIAEGTGSTRQGTIEDSCRLPIAPR